MPRQKEPVQLILAKNKSHIGKKEVERRLATEVQPCADGIAPPAKLTQAQRKHFRTLAEQLQKIKIMGETDCEALARYVITYEKYQKAVDDLRALEALKPKLKDDTDLERYSAWLDHVERVDRRIERYHKQVTALTRDLGMTITARCKLIVPKAEETKTNKFDKFAGVKNG